MERCAGKYLIYKLILISKYPCISTWVKVIFTGTIKSKISLRVDLSAVDTADNVNSAGNAGSVGKLI